MMPAETQGREGGLQFFGEVSASISHELRNALAVMNENAGLLEDLCLMVERGRPIDPSRVQRVASSVRTQVQRADRIVTSLNRFAHSVDRGVERLELYPWVQLFVELASRQASQRGISLVSSAPESSIKVEASAFEVLEILSLGLALAIPYVDESHRVELKVARADDKTLILLSGLKDTPLGETPLTRSGCSSLASGQWQGTGLALELSPQCSAN